MRMHAMHDASCCLSAHACLQAAAAALWSAVVSGLSQLQARQLQGGRLQASSMGTHHSSIHTTMRSMHIMQQTSHSPLGRHDGSGTGGGDGMTSRPATRCPAASFHLLLHPPAVPHVTSLEQVCVWGGGSAAWCI